MENIADLNPYILLRLELQFEKFLNYKYSQIQVVQSKIIPKISVLIRLCMAIIKANKVEIILRRLILEVRKKSQIFFRENAQSNTGCWNLFFREINYHFPLGRSLGAWLPGWFHGYAGGMYCIIVYFLTNLKKSRQKTREIK